VSGETDLVKEQARVILKKTTFNKKLFVFKSCKKTLFL